MHLFQRYYLKGPKAGMWDTFASNLPIMPDNLSYSKRGTVWVAGGLTRHPITDAMYKNVWIRKLICKVSVAECSGVIGKMSFIRFLLTHLRLCM
jgi:hypothetical protein